MLFHAVHHIAIICSDYAASRRFYTETLGFAIAAEHYREERRSWKLDLKMDDRYTLELFSFPDAPPRPTRPEACGLRHLAFSVVDFDAAVEGLKARGVATEPARVDAFTGKKFTFFCDPDGLPIEIYQL